MSLPPPFAELSPEEEQLVMKRLRRRIYRRRETIFRGGESPRAIYFVQSGVVELFHPSAPGHAPLSRVVSGRTLGAASLLLDTVHRVNAEAASQLTLEVLTKADLKELLAEHPSLAGKLSVALGARIVNADEYLVGRYLRNFMAFKSLPSEALHSLAARFQLKKLPAGSTIPEDGEAAGGLYFLEVGRMRLIWTAKGSHVASQELSPGAALGYGQPGEESAQDWRAEALQESSLWMLTKADLEGVLRRYPLRGAQPVEVEIERVEPPLRPPPAKLAENAIFAGLSEEELADIASHLQLVRYQAGQRILLAGSSPQSMYFIQEGTVRQVPSPEDRFGEGTTILGAGDFFGALALLTDTPHSVTVEATSEVQVWSLEKAEFDRLLLEYPLVAVSFSQHLADYQGKRTIRPARREANFLGQEVAEVRTEREAERRGVPVWGRARGRPGAGARLTRARDWFQAQSRALRMALIAVLILLLWLLLVSLPTALLARSRGGVQPARKEPGTTSKLYGGEMSPTQAAPAQKTVVLEMPLVSGEGSGVAESRPTPQASPTNTNPAYATVAVLALKLRAGPGVNYLVLRLLHQGDRLKLVEDSSVDGWIKVVSPEGIEGWVYSDFIARELS